MAAQDLEGRIKHLEDIEAIRNLIASSYHLLDEFKFEEFLDCLTDDVINEHDNVRFMGDKDLRRGKESFRNFLEEGTEKVKPFMCHQAFNPEIQVTGDKGSATYYMLAPTLLGPPAKRLAVWKEAMYHNEYRRVNGRWLISRNYSVTIFRTPYAEGWHRVGWAKDLGERGRRELPMRWGLLNPKWIEDPKVWEPK